MNYKLGTVRPQQKVWFPRPQLFICITFIKSKICSLKYLYSLPYSVPIPYSVTNSLRLPYSVTNSLSLLFSVIKDLSMESSVFVLTTYILIIIGKPAFSEPWKHDKFNELEDDTKVEPTSTTA